MDKDLQGAVSDLEKKLGDVAAIGFRASFWFATILAAFLAGRGEWVYVGVAFSGIAISGLLMTLVVVRVWGWRGRAKALDQALSAE